MFKRILLKIILLAHNEVQKLFIKHHEGTARTFMIKLLLQYIP